MCSKPHISPIESTGNAIVDLVEMVLESDEVIGEEGGGLLVMEDEVRC